jgi:hypothetical protein
MQVDDLNFGIDDPVKAVWCTSTGRPLHAQVTAELARNCPEADLVNWVA